MCTESLGSNGIADYKLRSEEEFEVSQLAVCTIILVEHIICLHFNEIVDLINIIIMNKIT